MTSTTPHLTTACEVPVQAAPRRVRLEYLDGLRGIAALYVVLHHTGETSLIEHEGPLPGVSEWLFYLLHQGHLAVAVFIVLSGYVLMMPVAIADNDRLPEGFNAYIKRRARRILPPYYAVLALSLLAIYAVKGLRFPAPNTWWNTSLPALTARSVLLHLSLLHNLSTTTIFKINYPLWSVATEFQIYFLFPLALLPLWRRIGAAATVTLATGVTILPYALLPHFRHLEGMCPWFVGLFAMGMAAANANFGAKGREDSSAVSRYSLVTALLVGGFGIAAFARPDIEALPWLFDTLAGLITAALLAACTAALQHRVGGVPFRIAAILQSRVPVALGKFSYSLYLIHAPILALVALTLHDRHLLPIVALWRMCLTAVPLSLGMAYLFYLVFERPFTRRR